MPILQLPELLTPQEAAKAIGVSPATLATWRSTGRYRLNYIKSGRLVRYREDDVREFIQRRTVSHPHAEA
jgi:excisionase family DNA binding protein